MRIDSFEPSEYTSPCGTIRVRKTGLTWSADVLVEGLGPFHPDGPRPPYWELLDDGVTGVTHHQAIARALVLLGLDDDHDDSPSERPDPEDELRW
jgi:hypothetical protein